MIKALKAFFCDPVWRKIAEDPFALKARAQLEVEIKRAKRARLKAEIKAEVLQELETGK